MVDNTSVKHVQAVYYVQHSQHKYEVVSNSTRRHEKVTSASVHPNIFEAAKGVRHMEIARVASGARLGVCLYCCLMGKCVHLLLFK